MRPKRNNRETPPQYGLSFFRMTLLISAFFLTGLFWGCDAEDQAPKKPQVVTKKMASKTASDAAPTEEKPKTTPTPETAKSPPPSSPDAGAGPKPPDILALLGLAPKTSGASGALSYNPKGKIDPFEPLFQQEPEAKARKKRRVRKGPLTPLEKVDLSQLQLTGVILAKSGNKALVKEASGKGYIVKVGTPIGINFGRIVKIQKDRIIVEEEVEDVMGKITVQKKEMRLQKPPGE